MIDSPLVSVIMPAYNAAPYIQAAIDSVLQQTYPNIELIVVNDGSTDETADIVKSYQSSKIRLINQENKGQSAANNRGFKEAKGEFIKFFDADDILSPNHIQRQVERLMENPDCVASSEVWRFWGNSTDTALYEPLANWKDLEPLEWLIIDNGKGLGMMQAAIFLIPRRIFEQAGGWDERLSLINDMDFSPRILLQARKVLFCSGARLYYRSGLTTNLSSQNKRSNLESSFTAIENTTKLLLQIENSPRVRQVLAFIWRVWSYKYYPYAMDLYKKSEDWINSLGGSPHFYFGGISGKLKKIIGWKMVRHLQILKAKLQQL